MPGMLAQTLLALFAAAAAAVACVVPGSPRLVVAVAALAAIVCRRYMDRPDVDVARADTKRKQIGAFCDAVQRRQRKIKAGASGGGCNRGATVRTRGSPTPPSLPQRVRQIVLTGGPGVGKTTLVEHLEAEHGHACTVVPEAATTAIDALNTLLGTQHQRAWRTTHEVAFADLVGRVALAQEEQATKQSTGKVAGSGAVVFDRTVLDTLGYAMQRGLPLPAYMTVEVAAAVAARVDLVFVLDPVASTEDIKRRNNATGRTTDPQTSALLSTVSCAGVAAVFLDVPSWVVSAHRILQQPVCVPWRWVAVLAVVLSAALLSMASAG